jgi:hypothetical protein
MPLRDPRLTGDIFDAHIAVFARTPQHRASVQIMLDSVRRLGIVAANIFGQFYLLRPLLPGPPWTANIPHLSSAKRGEQP